MVISKRTRSTIEYGIYDASVNEFSLHDVDRERLSIFPDHESQAR